VRYLSWSLGCNGAELAIRARSSRMAQRSVMSPSRTRNRKAQSRLQRRAGPSKPRNDPPIECACAELHDVFALADYDGVVPSPDTPGGSSAANETAQSLDALGRGRTERVSDHLGMTQGVERGDVSGVDGPVESLDDQPWIHYQL
jgi:hypothetical protein